CQRSRGLSQTDGAFRNYVVDRGYSDTFVSRKNRCVHVADVAGAGDANSEFGHNWETVSAELPRREGLSSSSSSHLNARHSVPVILLLRSSSTTSRHLSSVLPIRSRTPTTLKSHAS